MRSDRGGKHQHLTSAGSLHAPARADAAIARALATALEKPWAFYAIHGVTAEQVRHGVPDLDVEREEVREQLRAQSEVEWVAEDVEGVAVMLPGSGGRAPLP